VGRIAALLPLLLTLLGGSANAASMSYFLDQSNDPEGWLPNGTNYLKVTIADGVGGDIDVTVEILGPLTSIADSNFGIQSFLFNSTNVLSAANILGAPAGWGVSTDFDPAAPHLVADSYGRFEIQLSGSGSTRQAPTLGFTISIAGDSISDYAVAATNGSRGTTFFGAHVAGFVDQDPQPGNGNLLTSAWFGGATVVPEPGTASLLGFSLALLAWMRRRSAI